MLKKYDIKSLVLWLTNDCNLRCKYCYAEGGKKNEYMNFNIAETALQIPQNKNFNIQLAGGEPLLNFGLIKRLYEEVKNKYPKVKISMQTNGTLITKDIAKKLKEMNISLGISLDGPPQINEQLRGKTKEVVDGLKNLAEEGVIVNLNCVVNNININYLSQLIDFAHYIGNVNGIGLDLLRETGYTIKNNNVSVANSDDIRKNIIKSNNRLNELAEITGRKLVIREIEEAKQRIKENKQCTGYCYAEFGQYLVISPDGSAYPCSSFVGNKDYYMGNILDDKEINIIKLDNSRSVDPYECRNCSYKVICPRACPARVIINNRFYEQDCALRKICFEIAEKEGSR